MSRASKFDRLAARYAEEQRLQRDDYPRYRAMQEMENRRLTWKFGGVLLAACVLGGASGAVLVDIATSDHPHPAPCGPAARP